MNIHKSQRFWCEQKGYKVLTHCHFTVLYLNYDVNGQRLLEVVILTGLLVEMDSSMQPLQLLKLWKSVGIHWIFARSKRPRVRGSSCSPSMHLGVKSWEAPKPSLIYAGLTLLFGILPILRQSLGRSHDIYIYIYYILYYIYYIYIYTLF